MRPQLVVFDMAGTTVHDPGGVSQAFRATLADAGLDLEPGTIQTVMGREKQEAITLLVRRSGRADLESRVPDIHAAFVRRMVAHYRDHPALVEVPGTGATFRTLRGAGIRVAVNTGFSRPIARTILDRLGWEAAGLLDGSITSDEVPRGRPYPDMIRALMARFEIEDAARVAKVGDTPVDLEEGTNAGCGWVIGVTEGTGTRDQLAAAPHTHVIGSVAALPAIFGL